MVHITWGVVIAGGKGEQMPPDVDVAFLNLGSRPILSYTLSAFESCEDVSGVVVVADKPRIDSVLGMCQMFGFAKVQKIVPGGSSRQTSVMNGLKALDEDVSIVAVHDASRPCLSGELLGETIKAAKRYGSGVAAVGIPDAVKSVAKGLTVSETVRDTSLWLVQTPQAFRRDLLEKGYKTASKKRVSLGDDSTALELIKEEVHLVPSFHGNIKIRSAEDFNVAACLMRV